MDERSRITERQFHCVWTEAVGKPGYNKAFFMSLLHNMKTSNLIVDTRELKRLIKKGVV